MTAVELAPAVRRVVEEPSFVANIGVIATSVRAAGGYPRAVDDIAALKKGTGDRLTGADHRDTGPRDRSSLARGSLRS